MNVIENKIVRVRKLEIDLFCICYMFMELFSNVESI